MPLVGGGGAGNTAGSGGTAGTGSNLNYIGNKVYAYSGLVAGDASAYQTCLSFQTGNEIISAKFQYADSYEGGDARSLQLTMDSQVVYENVYDTAPLQYTDGVIHLVIPPFTKFTASFRVGTTTVNASMLITGEIVNA